MVQNVIQNGFDFRNSVFNLSICLFSCVNHIIWDFSTEYNNEFVVRCGLSINVRSMQKHVSTLEKQNLNCNRMVESQRIWWLYIIFDIMGM